MAVGSGVKLEQLQKVVTCGICKDHCTDPKVLPNCLHYYCKLCILRLALRTGINKSLSCPECRSEATLPEGGVNELKTAFFINHIMSTIFTRKGQAHETALRRDHDKVEVKCEACISGHNAESFCHQCAMFICHTCINVHLTMIAVFKGHEITSLQDLKKDEPGKTASTKVPNIKECLHNKETDTYCFDCDTLICRDCVVDHRGHTFQFSAVAAPEMKEELMKELEPLRQVGDRLSRAVEEVKFTRHEVEAQGESVAQKIHQSLGKFLKIVEEHKQTLLVEAEKIVNAKRENLLEQEQHLTQASAKVQNIVNCTIQYMERCTDREVTIIYTEIRKIIEQEIGESKLRRSLEPVEKPDVKVEISCVHDLQQFCLTNAKVTRPFKDTTQFSKGYQTEEKEEIAETNLSNDRSITCSGAFANPHSFDAKDITCNEFVVLDEVSFVHNKDTSLHYTWEEHGIQLQCSNAHIPSDSNDCRFSISAISLKEFILPDYFEPVSAAYCIDCPLVFNDPVTIKIQHCATESNLENLFFITSSDRSPPFKFHCIEGEFDSTFGVIKATAFSPFLIIKKLFTRSSLYSAYLYHSEKCVQESKQYWDLRFYIVRKLPVCEQSVKKSATNLQQSGNYVVQFTENADKITFRATGIREEPNSDNLYLSTITPLSLDKTVINRHTMEDPPCCELQLVNPNLDQQRTEQKFEMDGTKDSKYIKFVWPRSHGEYCIKLYL